MKYINGIAWCLFMSINVYAQTSNTVQTQTKIKQLETKIVNLRQSLNHATNKSQQLNQQLAYTEKEISSSIQKLNETKLASTTKQRQILALQTKIQALHEQLHTQQTLLAQHIRGRYMMDERQPLKWLLKQENPEITNRLLTLYQYIVESRRQSINQIQFTEKQLKMDEETLRTKYVEEQKLQQQLSQHQKKLEQDKNDSKVIIQSLSQDIKNNQQALTETLQNKNNLSNLVNTLAQESLIKTQRPLLFKNKKISRPITLTGSTIKKINQGVVFFVKEGTPVNAVYPGKVVFSDWLKGYGLLLIIDHGQGFMTLYAHNQSLFKQKGDAVAQGIQIATVGHSGGIKENGLYFEIRQYGKAISPLKWL